MRASQLRYTNDQAERWHALLPLQVCLCALVTGLAVWATRQVQHGMRLTHWMHRGPRAQHLMRMDLVWWTLLGVIYLAVLCTYVSAGWVAYRALQATRRPAS